MRKYIKKIVTEAIKEEKGLFSIYVEKGKEKQPLNHLPVMSTDYVPRKGEFINVMHDAVIDVYEVVEVNYIFHASMQEFQEGTIIVKETGRKILF